MAVNKTTELLEFKVEQDGAIADLERTKKSIINLKKEQQELNKAYKSGDITLEEYSSELVRVESVLKKQTSSYNTLQKSVAGVETQMDKLIKSNKEVAAAATKSGSAFNDAAKNINIAGVSVGDLGGKFVSFLNPATAAVGIITALGTAYAKSTIGAKDLEFAQNQLSSATRLVTNEFAGLFSSAEDGQGILTRYLNLLLKVGSVASVPGLIGRAFGVNLSEIADRSKELAMLEEQLQDLGRDELSIRDKLNERLEENQELLTDIGSEQTKYADKVFKTGQIIDNLRKNESELLDVKRSQLEIIDKQLEADPDNEAILDRRIEKAREISNIERDAEKRVQATLRLKDNLLDTETKRLETLKKQAQAEGQKTLEEETRLNLQLLESSRKRAHEEYLAEKDKFEKLKKEREKDLKSRQDLFLMAKKSIDDKKAKLDEEQVKRQNAILESEMRTMQFREEAFSQTSRLLGDLGADQKNFILAQLAADTASAIGSLVRHSEKPESEAERAARYLAGFARISANIGQAYRMIGSSAPVIGAGSLGTIITSSTGEQFVIQNGKPVSLEEARKKAEAKIRRAETVGDIATGASIGAAVGSIIPGIGTAIGAGVGAAVGGLVNAFKNVFGKGKAEGGYAGPGDKYEPKGFYHGGEVIWSKADVAAVGGPMIADSMRPTFKTFNVKGSGVFGGSSKILTAGDVVRIFQAMPPDVLDLRELAGARRRTLIKEKYTKK